jgi:hypothetical protein
MDEEAAMRVEVEGVIIHLESGFDAEPLGPDRVGASE